MNGAGANDRYDTIIVGGGITGAALCCALGQRGARVALLDRRGAPDADANAAAAAAPLRVSSLTPASRRWLADVGVWNAAADLQPAAQPFTDMRVWDADGWGEIHFAAAELGRAELGWIVANDALRAALWRRLEALPTVTAIAPARLVGFERDGDEARVELDDGRRLSAALAVGADGASSELRRRAGLSVGGWDYRQRGIVAVVDVEFGHRDTAWQRFLPTGPVAFLPLAGRRCSVVWSMHSERVDGLLALDDETFAERLGAAFGERLGALRMASARAAFPLRAQSARRYVGARVALIGDAAHVVHPLAGQGVNLGLLDAAALAAVVGDALDARQDIGAVKTLRRYQQRRRADNLLMLHALDGLARLFGNDLPPLRLLRNVGLNAVDGLGPLKRRLARRAMGLAG